MKWAISSGGERHVDIVEVGGSRPPSPTNKLFIALKLMDKTLFIWSFIYKIRYLIYLIKNFGG